MPKVAICTLSHNVVGLYLHNYGMYRESERNLLNSNISSTSPHYMANVSPLTAEISWWVWGTPANFNGYRIMASFTAVTLFTGGKPNFARCLAVYIFGSSCPVTESLLRAIFILRPSLALSYIGTVTARHSSSGCQPNFMALSRGRQLCSAGWPSCWASALILATY